MFKDLHYEKTESGTKNPFYRKPVLTHIFTHIIANANWCDGVEDVEGYGKPLKRGQYLTSFVHLADIGQISKTWVRKLFNEKPFKSLMSVQSIARSGIIVTIKDYDNYQGLPNKDGIIECPDGSSINVNGVHHGVTYHNKENNKLKNKDKNTTYSVNESETSVPEKKKCSSSMKEKKKTEGSLFWDKWTEAYRRKFNSEPIRNAKSNSICKRLVSAIPVDDRHLLVDFYFDHTEAFYVRSGYCLELFERDLNKLNAEMKSGAYFADKKFHTISNLDEARRIRQSLQISKENNEQPF